MWFPVITANGVLAFATSVYGAATTALVLSSHKDRQQRHVHFQQEQKEKRLEGLYSAYCEAWGRWHGMWGKSGRAQVSAAEAGDVNEALIRLEAHLRLNGHLSLANDFQQSVMSNSGIETQLGRVGKALGLLG